MKKTVMAMMAVVLVLTLSASTAFAATGDWQSSHVHGTPKEATVSKEVDVSSLEKPEIGTQFSLYLEPDPDTHDVPKMGDSGYDAQKLFTATMAAGIGYLLMSAYANKEEKEMV